MNNKALIELVRDCNREITPADRHGLLKLIETQAQRIAVLERVFAPHGDAYAYEVHKPDGDSELVYAAFLERYADAETKALPRDPLYR